VESETAGEESASGAGHVIFDGENAYFLGVDIFTMR
jgi:hypothetical protein